MRSREELIKYMEDTGVLLSARITRAFYAIDRADFVKSEYLGEAYGDYPLPIGYSQTISQPSTVAFMLELLQPEVGEKILDIGSGSGWTTAMLAQIVGSGGRVFGVEIIRELVDFGRENLAKYNFSHAKISEADSQSRGLPQEAPFDKILVSAAAEEIPKELIAQLKVEGRMVVPVNNSIYKIDKLEGEVRSEEFRGFAFVSLK